MSYLLLLVLTCLSQAGASGFERPVVIGGQSAGLAGIATPYVQGAEALPFNPAGLAAHTRGAQDVFLNGSLTSSHFHAPAEGSSRHSLFFPYGAMYARNFTDSFAAGGGVYTAAAMSADYGHGGQKTDLTFTEAALGASWRAGSRLSLGGAWRVLLTRADLDFASAHAERLSGLSFTGYRLGAQYRLFESTHLSAVYRSAVNIRAKGRLTSATGPEGDAAAYTTFPQAFTLGVEQRVSAKWRLLGEYVWTGYNAVNDILLSGQSGTIRDPRLETHWRNQNEVRLAGSFEGWHWPVRFGYAWTSQITSEADANPTLTPPGVAHTLTFGSGQNWVWGPHKFSLNGGFEYSFARGAGYAMNEESLHFGLDYIF